MSRPVDIPEDQWEAIKSLAIDENRGARIPVEIGPYSAFTMIGALQLAWRHPDMEGRTRDLIRGFGEQLQAAFTGGVLEPLLETGWDLRQDRCSGCGVPIASPNPECHRQDDNGVSMHARPHTFGSAGQNRKDEVPQVKADIPPEVACPFCGGYVRGHQWISAVSCSIIAVFDEPVQLIGTVTRITP